jgi:hypothetical protein
VVAGGVVDGAVAVPVVPGDAGAGTVVLVVGRVLVLLAVLVSLRPNIVNRPMSTASATTPPMIHPV